MAKAEVRVSKAVRGARPQVEIVLDGKITATKLAGLVQNVATNRQVYKAAGLTFCDGCKSGLDIDILDRYQQVIQVEY